MPEWFEDWFNTDKYLYIYRHRNEEDANNLCQLIVGSTSLKKGSKLLDLACGAGRHSILFAKNGFNVTGIDLSDNLLNIARKSAEESGLNIKFIKGDLRKFNLTERFHLIVNLFTSFGYFDDYENEEVINLASQHLMANGYFVIDFFNIVYLRKNLVPVSYDKMMNGIIKQERIFQENRLIKKITITTNSREKHYFESVRIYSCNEIADLILKNELKIVKKFGDYLGNNFDENNSPRIIIIAQK